jgi:hypothetical protein
MIVAFVTFHFDAPRTREQMKKVFESSAPKYLNLPGLTRKNYWLAEDGRSGGGIYFWTTREAAERCFNGEWRARVTQLYGGAPDIRYLDSPVLVDNSAGRIVMD